MTKRIIMGVENEFKLRNRSGNEVSALPLADKIIDNFAIPYFRKASSCVRLATGGSFYVDGSEPEVTTAPYILEPSAITAVAANLVLNRNVLVDAISKIQDYKLNGYSAHYNFTTPQFLFSQERRRELCYLLAQTVNPAVQLLLENRHSGGVMFRYREDGRIEICADFIPKLEDMVAALGFQVGMISTLDEWVSSGATFGDIKRNLKYSLDQEPQSTHSRQGYFLRTPEVIRNGRKAVLKLRDKNGRVVKLTAQELLLHYYETFSKSLNYALSDSEREIVDKSVTGESSLPIDHRGYPTGYHSVSISPIDPKLAEAPLMRALGNAAKKRDIDGQKLTATAIDWNYVRFNYNGLGINVSIDDLVHLDQLVEIHPLIFKRAINGDLNEEDLKLLKSIGIDDPESFIERLHESENQIRPYQFEAIPQIDLEAYRGLYVGLINTHFISSLEKINKPIIGYKDKIEGANIYIIKTPDFLKSKKIKERIPELKNLLKFFDAEVDAEEINKKKLPKIFSNYEIKPFDGNQ